MSALSRFAPTIARSIIGQHHRGMASVSVTDPVQKLFVDKVREFKSSNKGLDAAHVKALDEEMSRLKRVYQIQDDSKLAQLETKYPQEHQVSLHDIDEDKEAREKIAAGQYGTAQVTKEPSELLATIPEQRRGEFELPTVNKPDAVYILEKQGVPAPTQVGSYLEDREYDLSKKMTVKQLEEDMLVIKFGENMPTVHDDKSPERDTVNYPRLPIPDNTPPTRWHIIPESWFQFLYPKTGKTGPYVLFGGLSTFLLSKEWLVTEHEFALLLSMPLILGTAITWKGAQISEKLRAEVKKEVDDWDTWQKGNIEFLNTMISHYKGSLHHSLDELYDIRRQDVEAQLECEYRSRIKKIHDATKKRLNYLVAVASSQRQINHSNMVNWVISNAVSSFGPKQESEVLDNCIVNLKQLASKNANMI